MGQLGANQLSTREILKMADAYSKQLQRLQQQMIVFFDNFLQLSTKILTLCMHRQNTLENIIRILISKENCIKISCFQDNREKLERKDSIGLEIVALINGGLIGSCCSSRRFMEKELQTLES